MYFSYISIITCQRKDKLSKKQRFDNVFFTMTSFCVKSSAKNSCVGKTFLKLESSLTMFFSDIYLMTEKIFYIYFLNLNVNAKLNKKNEKKDDMTIYISSLFNIIEENN